MYIVYHSKEMSVSANRITCCNFATFLIEIFVQAINKELTLPTCTRRSPIQRWWRWKWWRRGGGLKLWSPSFAKHLTYRLVPFLDWTPTVLWKREDDMMRAGDHPLLLLLLLRWLHSHQGMMHDARDGVKVLARKKKKKKKKGSIRESYCRFYERFSLLHSHKLFARVTPQRCTIGKLRGGGKI